MILLIVILLTLASVAGWGCLFRRLQPAIPAVVTPVLGLGWLVFAGGILNLLHLAKQNVVVVLVAGGALFLLVALRDARAAGWRMAPAKEWLPYSGVMVAAVAALLVNASPSALNMHDDFEKYLRYPVRMLETGSILSGTMDASGSEILGGMSFLQAVPVIFAPLPSVNAIDGVLGLVLSMVLFVAIARAAGCGWLWSSAGSLMIAVIDPLYVNTSAAYLGTAGALALTLLFSSGKDAGERFSVGGSLAQGLILAMLFALKPSLGLLSLPIAVVHYAIAFFVHASERARVLRGAAVTLLGSLLFLSPWLLVHIDKYRIAWEAGATVSTTAGSLFTLQNPLSLAPILYGFGVTSLHYTLTVILACLMVIGLWRFLIADSPVSRSVLALGIGVALSFVATVLFIGPFVNGWLNGLRYLVPFIAATTIMFPVAARAGGLRRTGFGQAGFGNKLVPLSALCVAASFVPSLFGRVGQFARLGHMLPFPTLAHDRYLDSCRMFLSEDLENHLRGIQSRAPEGSVILGWTRASFLLDHTRSKIVDMDPAGLATPWTGFAFDGTEAQKLDSLRKLGISHVLWQHAGFGHRPERFLQTMARLPFRRERQLGERQKLFSDFLSSLSQGSSETPVIYRDALFVLVELQASDDSRPQVP